MNEENKGAIPQPAMEPAFESAAVPVVQPELASQPEAAPVAVAQPQSVLQPEFASAPVVPAPASEFVPEPASVLEAQPVPASTSEPQSACAGVPAQPMAAPAGYRQPDSTVAVPVSVKPGGTASLVCGILAAALGFFSPIAGVVLGIIAIVQAKKWPGSSKAKAGKVCGVIGIVLAVLSFVLGIALTVLAYAIM